MYQKINDSERTPVSTVGSPTPNDEDTPVQIREANSTADVLATSIRDDVLPVLALDTAILMSIGHGARHDERKTRDFLSSVMVVGGRAQIPEERLKEARPRFVKDVVIGTPLREFAGRERP